MSEDSPHTDIVATGKRTLLNKLVLCPTPTLDDNFPRHKKQKGTGRCVGAVSFAFLFVTILVFLIYRIAFLNSFAPSTRLDEAVWICLAGLRIDLALVAFELLVATLVFFTTRIFRLRAFAMALFVLTFIHVGLAVANFLFFSERGQHLWEMFIANISRPGEIWVAVRPFFDESPATSIAAAAIIVLLAIGAWRVIWHRVPAWTLDLWRPRYRMRQTFALGAVMIAANLDPVSYQQTKYWNLGWIPLPAASQFYMNFNNYEANQAVINPVQDLVRFYVPAILASAGGSTAPLVDPQEAIAFTQSLLGIQPLDSDYPLLQSLPPGPEIGLKNMVLIVVEGLSRSILHKKVEGEEVTPFLNEMSRQGMEFSNIIQSYNATDGSVFSIVTGMYKTFQNQSWQYFLPIEVNSHFGSVPYLLGKETYRHYAMFGFQNRREDFAAFFRNQGYETYDPLKLKALLDQQPGGQPVRNALGLFDHVLFDQTAKILAENPPPFSALVITATTHSPWVVPSTASTPFKNNRLNAFRYLDESIKAFIASLETSLKGFDDTLFIVTGDHTSLTFDGGTMERLRVPLIMFGSRLEAQKLGMKIYSTTTGSHVDIVPTALQLLDGAHPYSGMGVSLISPNRGNARVVSSNRFDHLYLRDGFAMRFSPLSPGAEDTQLFAIEAGEIEKADLSSTEIPTTQRLRREFLSLYETSARLAKDKRAVPVRLEKVYAGTGLK